MRNLTEKMFFYIFVFFKMTGPEIFPDARKKNLICLESQVQVCYYFEKLHGIRKFSWCTPVGLYGKTNMAERGQFRKANLMKSKRPLKLQKGNFLRKPERVFQANSYD